MTRCDGQGVNRGNGSGSRASPGGRSGASLPRVRGPVDQADRGSSRPLARDDQGVLLRPDGREGTRGQGALPGRLSGLRRADQRAQRQGRRVRVLQALASGRDRAGMDPERVSEAMRAWQGRYGRPPSSYDWSDAGTRRSSGCKMASGRRRRPSPSCTARGRRRGLRRSRPDEPILGSVGSRPCGRDARLAEGSVRINPRVDELDGLADELRRAGASDRVDTAAIDIAQRVPSALAVLADRGQLRACGEPRFVLVLCPPG